MFDFHLHSCVSNDSVEAPLAMAQAACQLGLKEICFTDHVDYNTDPAIPPKLFTIEDYDRAYNSLEVSGLTIRHGVELGMTVWNKKELQDFLTLKDFDFVIGSVHMIDGYAPYQAGYWQNDYTVRENFLRYLEGTLDCVRIHKDFDVLGHLTFVCKTMYNPDRQPVRYADFADITDEILRILIQNGKGMEINTSGILRCNDFIPNADFFRRFKELGGEIVTIGSDAHIASHVGQYHKEALAVLKEILGYVCTFQNRQPVFHKL